MNPSIGECQHFASEERARFQEAQLKVLPPTKTTPINCNLARVRFGTPSRKSRTETIRDISQRIEKGTVKGTVKGIAISTGLTLSTLSTPLHHQQLRKMTTLQLLLMITLQQTIKSVDICGSYCGPSWCGSKIADECSVVHGSACNKAPTDCQESTPTDGSCADGCCKIHDTCCGSTDRRPCNNDIIQCLKNCKKEYPHNSSHCTHDKFPVPVDAILVAMELDPYGCCGTKCSGSDAQNDTLTAAPEQFLLDFTTDIDGVGVITLNITRNWSPIGVDHLYTLVNAGFYDGSAFTRVDGGFVLQFGISGIPSNNLKYNASIQDDPVIESNVQYTMSFAATGSPNSRTTQLFINYNNNTELDGEGFSPVGIVVKGNEYLDRVHDPTPGDSNGVNQDEYATKGNAWIREKYPDINFIKKAAVRSSK